MGLTKVTYSMIEGATFNVRDFGAVPDWNGSSGTDNAPAFNAALEAIKAAGGGTLYISGPGSYMVNDICYTDTTYNLGILFDASAKVVANFGFSDAVFKIVDKTLSRSSNVIIQNPSVDCSLGTSPTIPPKPSNAYCTAFYTESLNNVIYNNVDIYGGTIPTNLNADSGISDVGSLYRAVFGGTIRGFNDSGIYWNGDNTYGIDPSEGITNIIEGVLFEACAIAVSIKREAKLTQVNNCSFYRCGGGIMAQQVADNPLTLPGRRYIISNNHFRLVGSNNVRIRSVVDATIVGNVFEDWGYYADGTAVNAATNAIVIQGSQNIDVKANSFHVGVDYPATTYQRGVQLENLTTEGTLYRQGYNNFSSNTYKNIHNAIVEAADGFPNMYLNEYFVNCTNLTNTTFNAQSLITYTLPGDTQLYYKIGNTYLNKLAGYAFNPTPVTVDVSSIGVLGAGSTTSPIYVSVPGAASGDEIVFIRQSADLSGAVNILITGRAVPDELQIVIKNIGASGFDFTGEILKVAIRRHG